MQAEILRKLNNEGNARLVLDNDTGLICVRKNITKEQLEAYKELKNCDIAGIPQIVELEENGEEFFLYEEYVEGVPLSSVISSGKGYTQAQINSMMESLEHISEELRSRKISFEKTNPDNIMVTPTGKIYLIGHAKKSETPMQMPGIKDYLQENIVEEVLTSQETPVAPKAGRIIRAVVALTTGLVAVGIVVLLLIIKPWNYGRTASEEESTTEVAAIDDTTPAATEEPTEVTAEQVPEPSTDAPVEAPTADTVPVNLYLSENSIVAEAQYAGRTDIQRCMMDGNVEAIRNEAFMDCSSLKTVFIPYTMELIGNRAFMNCVSLEEIQVICNIDTLGDECFAGCTNLRNIRLSSYMNRIGTYAFSGCTSLTNIMLPQELKKLGAGAFWNCSSLAAIDIPANVENIETGTFCGCTSLKRIELPFGVKSIGNAAFSHCESLKEIVIPPTVKSMMGSIFEGCNSNMVIKCAEGSVAMKYAQNHDIQYELIEREDWFVMDDSEDKIDDGWFIEGNVLNFDTEKGPYYQINLVNRRILDCSSEGARLLEVKLEDNIVKVKVWSEELPREMVYEFNRNRTDTIKASADTIEYYYMDDDLLTFDTVYGPLYHINLSTQKLNDCSSTNAVLLAFNRVGNVITVKVKSDERPAETEYVFDLDNSVFIENYTIDNWVLRFENSLGEKYAINLNKQWIEESTPTGAQLRYFQCEFDKIVASIYNSERNSCTEYIFRTDHLVDPYNYYWIKDNILDFDTWNGPHTIIDMDAKTIMECDYEEVELLEFKRTEHSIIIKINPGWIEEGLEYEFEW